MTQPRVIAPVKVNMSLYGDDLDELDKMIELLRSKAAKYPSRSRLVRLALADLLKLDPNELVERLQRLPANRTLEP